MFIHPELSRGSSKIIVASRFRGGEFPALEFLREQLTRAEQTKLLRLLDMAASNWPIKNFEKCKQIEGDLWEFKSHQIRVPYVLRPGNLVVVTHAFRKKKHDIPSQEITRAFDIVSYFDQYFNYQTNEYMSEE